MCPKIILAKLFNPMCPKLYSHSSLTPSVPNLYSHSSLTPCTCPRGVIGIGRALAVKRKYCQERVKSKRAFIISTAAALLIQNWNSLLKLPMPSGTAVIWLLETVSLTSRLSSPREGGREDRRLNETSSSSKLASAPISAGISERWLWSSLRS